MVRPIDIQQVILQTNAIEKIQHVQQQHSSIQQEYLTLQFKEEKRLIREKVQDTSEAEKSEIKDRENNKKKQYISHKIDRTKEHDDNITEIDKNIEIKERGKFIDVKA